MTPQQLSRALAVALWPLWVLTRIHRAFRLVTYRHPATEAAWLRAQQREPQALKWPAKLAALYEWRYRTLQGEARKQAASQAVVAYQRSLQLSGEITHDYSDLPKLAWACMAAEQFGAAARHARRLVRLGERNGWGNAIHRGHTVLGRLALRLRKVEEAREHLLAAGRTPGSPQLNSYGPDLALAKALFAAGERETVAVYLRLCSRFWIDRTKRIPVWLAQIEGGETPDWGSDGT